MDKVIQIYSVAVLLYETVIYIWFLNQLLICRFSHWVVTFIVLGSQLLCHEYIRNDSLRFGLEIVFDLTALLICYKGKPLHNAIYTIIYYAIMFLCDTVCALLICLLCQIGLEDISSRIQLQIFLSLLSRAILPLFILLLVKLWKNTYSKWYYLYPVPITIVVIQFFFSPFGEKTLFYKNPKWMYVLVVIFMYSSMLYVILVQREQNEHNIYLHKLKIMDIHNEEQIRYIKEIQSSYKNLSKNIHDARHHLDLLNTYIKLNKWKKARQYLKSLYSELENAVISYTGNADIDSIIYSKQIAFQKVKMNVYGLLLNQFLGWRPLTYVY